MPHWEFDVVNNMSGPINAIDKDINHLTININAAAKATDAFGANMKKHAEGGGFFSKLFGAEGFFASEMIEKLAEVGKEALKIATEFVEAAAEAREFKEESLSLMEVQGKSAEAAESEFEALGFIAKNSAMTKKEVMSQYQELFSFTQKFGDAATENVIRAGADIQKLQGKGAQEAFIGVLRNIDALGGLSDRTIRQLRGVAVATPEKLKAAVAEQFNTTIKGAEAMLKAGQISQEDSVKILLGLVRTNIDKGGELGEYAKEVSGGSVIDQFKNVKDSFNNMFEDIDTSPMAGALSDLASSFDPTSEAGKEFRSLFKDVFEDISIFVRKSIDAWKEWGPTVIGVVHNVWTVVEFLAKSLGVVYDIVTGLTGGFFAVGDTAFSPGGAFSSRAENKNTTISNEQKNLSISNEDLTGTNRNLQSTSQTLSSSINELNSSVQRTKGFGGGGSPGTDIGGGTEGGSTLDAITNFITGKGHVRHEDADEEIPIAFSKAHVQRPVSESEGIKIEITNNIESIGSADEVDSLNEKIRLSVQDGIIRAFEQLNQST